VITTYTLRNGKTVQYDDFTLKEEGTLLHSIRMGNGELRNGGGCRTPYSTT